ncbi:glutamate racemase [bacterium]|nr:glutamate racemase [bacterium]
MTAGKSKRLRVAVFDSGIGGITVLNELRSRYRGIDYLYFGDTANVPYGTKSPMQIRHLVTDAVARLKSESVDVLVVACNTASCVAIEAIHEIMDGVPVLDVVQAGVQAVNESLKKYSDFRRVVIFGTKATVKSHTYADHLESPLAKGKIQLVEKACPLLVPMIEEGWQDHRLMKELVREYTQEFSSGGAGIGLLACTHYPWIQGVFETVLPGWKILNSAYAVADLLQKKVPAERLNGSGESKVRWIFTDPDAVPDNVAR